MRFRTRLFVALFAAALVPVALLAYGVRRELSLRVAADAAEAAGAAVDDVRRDLRAEERGLRRQLGSEAAALAAGNDLRLAVLAGDSGASRRLLDWAGAAMRSAGLDLLRLHDANGRILSSGHFRNEFGGVDPLLPAGLAGEGLALARVRSPGDPLLAWVAAENFTAAGRRFTLVGGRRADSGAMLRARGAVEVALRTPDEISVAGTPIAQLPVPFFDALAGRRDTARIVLTRDDAGLVAARRRVDRWTAAAVGVTLLLSLALAAWLAARIARPITELADKTRTLDLDRLDQRFGTDREDEIGALAGLLDAMVVRLRRSTAALRESERRAATGDLARQVNHDIKNGLAPIRHVLRHLAQVAERDPATLAAVYADRRATLESSVDYLDGLAREYARLTPALTRTVCRPADVLRAAAAAVHAPNARVEVRAAETTPSVRADALVLRRIVDNLTGNAVDALEGREGTVTLSSERSGTAETPLARIVVADTGRGMSREELERAFQDFHTNKPGGTGLGLSVVRRLVGDLGGTLRVETVPGEGSRFIVELRGERA